MKVNAIDYISFNELLRERNITDETVHEWSKQVFIEIQGEEDLKHPDCVFWFKKNHPNVLRLAFDDVDEDVQYEDLDGNPIGMQAKVISDEQAKELFDFIQQHRGKNFIVHCHAGVSRSGAVAQFICEQNDIPLEEFRVMNPYAHPNNAILRKLRSNN